jgi:hypothetical protein
LQGPPYNFIAGDSIYVRVIAYNEFGWGQPSPRNVKNYIMYTTRPSKQTRPKLFMKNNENGKGIDVKISWDELVKSTKTGGLKIESYDVIWDEASLTQQKNLDGSIPEQPLSKLKRLKETSSPFVLLKNLIAGKIYRFRVRSRNACGYGSYSEEGSIELVMVPDRMAAVRTSFSRGTCDVVISWIPPRSYGSSIKRFYIQVINPRATFAEQARSKPGKDCYNCLSKCGENGITQFCVVPMSRLMGAPFNLRQGDEIKIQAYAENGMGIARDPSALNSNSVNMV